MLHLLPAERRQLRQRGLGLKSLPHVWPTWCRGQSQELARGCLRVHFGERVGKTFVDRTQTLILILRGSTPGGRTVVLRPRWPRPRASLPSAALPSPAPPLPGRASAFLQAGAVPDPSPALLPQPPWRPGFQKAGGVGPTKWYNSETDEPRWPSGAGDVCWSRGDRQCFWGVDCRTVVQRRYEADNVGAQRLNEGDMW